MNGLVIASSLFRLGRALTLLGFGGSLLYFLSTRYGRRPRPGEIYSQANWLVTRDFIKPLFAMGLVGAVIWIVAAVR